MRKHRSVVIDMIRGLSVLYIVGYWHLFNYTKAFPQYNSMSTRRFTLIVLGLFTLMSGFLIGSRTWSLNVNYILRFYNTRILRLYPPFVLAILAFYILGLAGQTMLLESAMLISMFSKPAPPTLWFINMIVIFYAIVPLLIYVRANTIKYVSLCIALMSVVFICSKFYLGIDLRTILYFPVFAVGIWLGQANGLLNRIDLRWMTVLFVVSVMLTLRNIFPTSIEADILNIPLVTFGSLLIFVIAMKGEVVITRYTTVVTLSYMLSYAGLFMYMFHRPLFKILLDIYFPSSGTQQIIYLVAVCLPIIIIISWWGQKAYDQLLTKMTS